MVEGEGRRMLSLVNAMVMHGRFTYLIRFAQYAKFVQKEDDLFCSCLCLGGCWQNSTGGRAGDALMLLELLDAVFCLERFLRLPREKNWVDCEEYTKMYVYFESNDASWSNNSK